MDKAELKKLLDIKESPPHIHSNSAFIHRKKDDLNNSKLDSIPPEVLLLRRGKLDSLEALIEARLISADFWDADVQKKYKDYFLADNYQQAEKLRKMTSIEPSEATTMNVYCAYVLREQLDRFALLYNFTKIKPSEEVFRKANEVYERRGKTDKLNGFLRNFQYTK